MITEYHCRGTWKDHVCGKLLFKGSLELILTRSGNSSNTIESKCPRCGELNTFTYNPTREVRK